MPPSQMWSYLLFLLHLSEKDPNDYSAHEWHVADLLQRHEEVRRPLSPRRLRPPVLV
jgi:hypothetical protein